MPDSQNPTPQPEEPMRKEALVGLLAIAVSLTQTPARLAGD